MKRGFSILLMLMITTSWALAQKTITGKVVSQEENRALPGVTIVVKGTTTGTTTDSNGEYSINASPTDVLIFSYISYKTIEVSIANQAIINVSLENDFLTLEELVVVGYGRAKKKDLTGAVTQIRAEDFEQRTVSSLSEALAGTMAGVQVSSYSGAPGSESFISIRGLSTINDNSVLWVVDGMPLNSIDFLNPQDIESVHVLKDASAAAIYGSQAANGVIIIETKKGRAGAMKIDFTGVSGVQSIARKPSIANAIEYANIQNQGVLNDGGSVLTYPNPESLGEGTNWWNQVTQSGLAAQMHNYHLSISKGEENYNVSSSVSYFNQDGVLKGGGYERINFRLNTEFKPSKKVKIGENFIFSNQLTKNGLDDYLVWDAIRLEPVTPIYLPEYEQAGKNEFSIFSPTLTDIPNAAGQLARNFNDSRSFKTVGNIYLEYEPIEYLSFRSEFGVETEIWENNWFSPNYYIEPTDKNDENSVGSNMGNKFVYNWNNILTFNKSFGDHNLTIMGATTTNSDTWKSVYGTGRNTPSNHRDLRYIQSTTSAWFATGSNYETTSFSYLSRLNYNYKEKYLLTASIRRDGSSKFPTENKWATFPSVSAGWVISEENFMNNFKWLDLFKVRVAWGQIGNDNIPFDAQFTTIDNYYYVLGPGQTVVLGKAPGQIGNTGLIWETIEDINLGVDAEFIGSKIRFAFDIFQRNSYDMLMQKALLSYMGSGFGRQWANIGSMSTKGWEFEIIYKDNVGDFRYNVGLNVSRSSSKMLNLADGEAIWEGNDQRLGMLTYTAEGIPVGSFYGFVTDGIFQNLVEINNHSNASGSIIQPIARPGDFRFFDLNGDGRLTNEFDRRIIGNPEADFSFGLNMSASYKWVDLRLLFTGSYGNELLTPILAYTHSGRSNYNSYGGLYNDAWSGEGTSNTQPRISNIDQNQNFRYSDYYVSDGSYIRLKSFQLGFALPAKWLSSIKTQSVRLYINAENLFTITNYQGLDPDVGPYYSNVLLRGVDWGNYPLPRIVSVGINASF